MRWWMPLVALLWSQTAVAGPFGTTMGQSIATLNARQASTKNTFTVTVPTPNAELESYTAVATPQTGLCKIWGVGRDHRNDRSGENVRGAFERLKTLLDIKYGAAEKFDFLDRGALWDEPHEWVMAVNKNERKFVAYWTKQNANMLADGIAAISLEVRAYASDIAYLDLTYEYANFARCKELIGAQQAEGL